MKKNTKSYIEKRQLARSVFGYVLTVAFTLTMLAFVVHTQGHEPQRNATRMKPVV